MKPTRLPNQIPYLTMLIACSLLISSCRQDQHSDTATRAAMAMMLDDADAPQNALVWTRSNTGEYQTLLLNGNKNHTQLVASVPRLLLTTDENVFEVKNTSESVFLCNCNAWAEINFENECPASLESVAINTLSLVQSGNPDTEQINDSINMDLLQLPIEENHLGKFVGFHQEATVTGSIGPYVFIAYERSYNLCNEEKTFSDKGFKIFDIETMTFASLLTEEEANSVDKNEKQDALAVISETTGFSNISIDDLELAEVKPMFFYGMGFSVGYKFEADSQMEATENNWGSYEKSVTIQAQQIPSKLAPYAIAPSVVRNLVHNETIAIGGWMLASGNSKKIVVLLEELLKTPLQTDTTENSLVE